MSIYLPVQYIDTIDTNINLFNVPFLLTFNLIIKLTKVI